MLEEDDESGPLEEETPKHKEEKPKEEKKSPTPKKRNTNQEVLLADKVLKMVGKQNDLYSCTAVNLYENRFRVNLMLKNGKISDSFFIRISTQGEILYANPNINRRY
jgi:hypothetical protein